MKDLPRAAAVALVTVALMLPAIGVDAQRNAVPKIGVIRTPPQRDAPYQAFLQGLRDHRYVEGKTIQIEYRWGDPRQFPEFASELVRLNVDLIFARPGGNATGLTALGSDLGGKRLEILKEIVPGLSRVGILWNPAVPDKVVEWQQMEAPARRLGLQLHSAEARGPEEFERAFGTIRAARMQAVITLGEPLMYGHRALLIDFVTKQNLPAIFNWREFVEAGALIAYGPSISDLYRRAASYVHKILTGAKPGELPIEEPRQFELAINLRTAKALGVTIPTSLLIRAEHVVE